MPPEAFTPISGPTAARISATSCAVAPAGGETGGGLDEIRAGRFGTAGWRRVFCVSSSSAVSRITLTMAPAGVRGLDHGLRYRCARHRYRPSAARPTLITMSISCAPARSAAWRLGDLGLGAGGAQRKADHGADLDRRTGQFRLHQRHPVGVHAHAGETVLARLAADLDDVGAGGVGLEDGVIDQGGDGGIDPGEPLAGRDARCAGGDDLLRIARAGLDAALHAAGADLVRQVEAFALFGRGAPAGHPGQHFLADLRDQSVEFRGVHDDDLPQVLAARCRMIFCDPRLVPSAGERRLQPGAQNLLRLGLGQEPCAERKHIRIIVFAAIASGSFIIAQGRANARNLVRRHAGADARAIDNHAARGAARQPPVRRPSWAISG